MVGNERLKHARNFGFERGHFDTVKDRVDNKLVDKNLTVKSFLRGNPNCLCRQTTGVFSKRRIV